jgi:hypothetical protein
LFAGLDGALDIRSALPGDRYASQVDEVLVLSDGAPTVGNIIATEEILRLIGETNRYSRVTIHTVFLGSKVPGARDRVPGDYTPYELMAELAKQNGGKFVHR